jgi:hypothetical protein
MAKKRKSVKNKVFITQNLGNGMTDHDDYKQNGINQWFFQIFYLTQFLCFATFFIEGSINIFSFQLFTKYIFYIVKVLLKNLAKLQKISCQIIYIMRRLVIKVLYKLCYKFILIHQSE